MAGEQGPGAAGDADTAAPVEAWPTSAIRAALLGSDSASDTGGDIATWRRIAAALMRDPYGRTARQVEEVLAATRPTGIANAMRELLQRARTHLEAGERAEVARHVRLLMDRSGLGQREFASRIGVTAEDIAAYLDRTVSPPAPLMIRMRRLADRCTRAENERSDGPA